MCAVWAMCAVGELARRWARRCSRQRAGVRATTASSLSKLAGKNSERFCLASTHTLRRAGERCELPCAAQDVRNQGWPRESVGGGGVIPCCVALRSSQVSHLDTNAPIMVHRSVLLRPSSTRATVPIRAETALLPLMVLCLAGAQEGCTRWQAGTF